jgi:hypothetical protein
VSREPAPPASFRPQGFVSLSAVLSLRNRAGFVSHRRRSWDSPFEGFPSREVSRCFHPDGPTYRFTSPFSRHRSTGPADEAPVSGLRPVSRVPCGVACDEHAGCRILPWVFPFQGLGVKALSRISPGLLSRAWLAHSRKDISPKRDTPQQPSRRAPQSLNRLAPVPLTASREEGQ